MTAHRIAAGSAVCCAVLFVSACGGGTSATGNAGSTPTTSSSSSGAARGAPGAARGFPGATGLLAQIDGTTLQVQGTDTQTAVTYSGKTTFTNTVAAKHADIVAGVCIQARTARTPGAGGAAPTAAPGASNGPIKATSVAISPAVNGTCSVFGGARLPGGGRFGGTGDPSRPAGAPTSGQTRRPGANGFGGGFGGFGAFGKVTAVNGNTLTVESSRPAGGSATTSAPATQTVQTSSATTYTRTGAASAKALAVGLCVTALGKASDTGSIAATSIALRPAENGSCSSGFGGPGPGGPAPAGGGAGA